MLGHVSQLRRKSVGNFLRAKWLNSQSWKIWHKIIIQQFLIFITIDEALTDFSVVNLNDLQSSKFRNGQQLEFDGHFDDNIKVYDHNNNLVGIAYKKIKTH